MPASCGVRLEPPARTAVACFAALALHGTSAIGSAAVSKSPASADVLGRSGSSDRTTFARLDRREQVIEKTPLPQVTLNRSPTVGSLSTLTPVQKAISVPLSRQLEVGLLPPRNSFASLQFERPFP